MVIVILVNVLIAQLSYTYSEPKSNANLQYAIDRIVIVTRVEHSRLSRFVSVSVETEFNSWSSHWPISNFYLTAYWCIVKNKKNRYLLIFFAMAISSAINFKSCSFPPNSR